MEKFGDEFALITYIRYVRWPLAAVGLMILGLVIGVFFGGLLGSIEGRVG